MSLTEIEKSYIAGFIDVEGSIVISNLHGKNEGKAGAMKVVASNTNKPVLEFICLQYGGSVHSSGHKNKKQNKPCFQWIISSQKALSFLIDIEPYLKIKKLQAQTAIAFQRGRHHRHAHYPLSEEELAVAEAQRIIMAALNKKGV